MFKELFKVTLKVHVSVFVCCMLLYILYLMMSSLSLVAALNLRFMRLSAGTQVAANNSHKEQQTLDNAAAAGSQRLLTLCAMCTRTPMNNLLY